MAFVASLKEIEKLEDTLKQPEMADPEKASALTKLEAEKEKCAQLKERMNFATA